MPEPGTQDWPESAPAPGAWRHGLAVRARLLLPILGGLSVAGLLGTYQWRLELFSHFIAWYALGSGVLAVLLFFLGLRRWAAVALLLALLQAFQPLSWYLGDDGEAKDGVPCRVLLANVLTSNTQYAALLKLIEEKDPDIVCVQEVGQDWARALEPLHDAYPMHLVVPRGDNFGIAVYSRVSPEAPREVFSTELGIPAITVSIEIEGVRADLLSLHTVPPINGPMASLRGAALDAARTWYEAQAGSAIMVGDLNMTMYSPVYRSWIRGLDIKNARAGHGPLGSWPTFVPFLRLPLDQCLVSPAVEVVDCQLGPKIGSDHLPLIVDLRLGR